MIKNIIISFSLGLIVTGCSSKPEPVDLTQASDAYNMAYGTYLTQPYSFGGRTYQSPLKDFSQDEVETIEKEFNKPNGGNASVFFGAISILTGNFTGVIDVVGGTAANIASSKHPSSRSGWIVSVDATQASDGVQAKQVATKIIQTKTIELLESKGNKIEKVTLKERTKKRSGTTAYQINDKAIFGMVTNHYYDNKNAFELNSDKTKYVVTGDTNWWGVQIANFMVFDKNYVKGYKGLDGYEKFIKDLTATLPENYKYYSSTLPRTQFMENTDNSAWNCDCFDKTIYSLNTHIIPSIYSQGERYDFIQSER
ncbi:hypothetical protein VHA01S_030_00150 [Vibrio halioticoli NBRC 102217]|uniref:Uncharacterized protein n=1 Tax=Vibrio halioticoli NBRC 102217 TaxID=1219072 RepID=V5HL89_9VIBR|nr:hypothetical protein [Vibrio halioticoli]GAD89940.1 hypothetical protein VHA01S_030_00150 [Vibrio halioticoli NBRC 102217]